MPAERCAYLVSRYPGITHTFVVGEVLALRRAGVDVHTASVRRVADDAVLTPLDADERRTTHAILPTTARQVLGCHLRAGRRSPIAYVRTAARAARTAHTAGRARLWQVFYFGEAMMLWAWMEQHGLRHVHVHHANVSADVALLACAFANAARPAAAQPWSWSLTLHGPTELVDVATHKLALKVHAAAAVVCTSDFARSQVLAIAEEQDRHKVRTVRCGIDVDRFAPGPSALTHAGGDGQRTIEIVCVAALSRRKGHAVLLDAFALLLARGRDVRLVVAGDGEERAALEHRAARPDLRGRVRFAGALGHDAVRRLYDDADIACLPSYAEGVPTVLMEAMAMEIPVVATGIMGVPELVEDGRSGLLVPPARPDLLADALERLVGDPALRRAMGSAGRERVVGHYEVDRSAARLREVLRPFTQSVSGVG